MSYELLAAVEEDYGFAFGIITQPAAELSACRAGPVSALLIVRRSRVSNRDLCLLVSNRRLLACARCVCGTQTTGSVAAAGAWCHGSGAATDS